MENLNRLLVGTIFGEEHSKVEDSIYYKEEALTVQNEG